MHYFDMVLSVLSLTILEIILGIDNLIFLAILTEKLPPADRKRARYWGLCFALITRLILLASAVWMMRLTKPLIMWHDVAFSVRDVFLIVGGLFLIVKASQEIHLECAANKAMAIRKETHLLHTFWGVVVQVALMDIIFSLDSVLTAVGLTAHFVVMVIAICIAMLIMLFASAVVSAFIERHPSIKMLALSFLMMIGTVLLADGFAFHIPRGYVYFSMGFSMGVEMLNVISAKRRSRHK
jgi:predicted tellurium resistance membrane protein TerC